VEKVIEIPQDIRQRMIEHAIEGLPNEACGLLAGPDGGRIEAFYPIRNQDQSAVTYRLDGRQQLAVQDEIEAKEWEVLGVFHSHTRSEAYPSATDRERAFWPYSEDGMRIFAKAHHFLVSLQGPEPVVRAFWIEDQDQVHELEVRIV
jgi:proteasome lid subunit RPN8/RPN11